MYNAAIIQELKELDRGSSGREKVTTFVKKLESLKSWEQILKLLLVSHRAIHAGTTTFLGEFQLHTFKNIQELPNHIKELKLYIRCGLVRYYCNYLKAYSEHYFAISKALEVARKRTEIPQIDLNTLKNFEELKKLLLLAFKLEDILTASIEVVQVPLVKELGRMLLSDAVEMYNALQVYVSAAIPKIFDQDEEICVKLDEHYSDLIKNTRTMIEFNQMRVHFNNSGEIEEPIPFRFETVFNKKEELFINEIRKQRRLQKIGTAPPMTMARNGSVQDRKNESPEQHQSHESPLSKKRNSLTSRGRIQDTDPLDEDEELKKGQPYISLLQKSKEAADFDQEDSFSNENDSYIGNLPRRGIGFQKVTFVPKKVHIGIKTGIIAEPATLRK